MARNPDVTPYVDLSLYDRDAQDIFEQALADATVKFPGWVPREAHTEVLLMEVLALIAEESVFAVNRLPGAVVATVLGLYGIVASEGTPPTATARVHVVDAAGYSLPAGTTLRLTADLAEPLLFELSADLAVPAGQTSAVGTVVGESATDAANGTPAGTTLELIDTVMHVESVVLETAVTGGAWPETDDAFVERGAQRLRRLVSTLVLPEHFAVAALEEVDVERARAIDLYDPAQANERQTVAITGGPTGGTLTLTFDGQTTTAIAHNATAVDVQTALEGLSNLAVGDVVASGGPLPGADVVVTFEGALAGADVALMTADGALLTGGTTPTVTVTETRVGGAAQPGDHAGHVTVAVVGPGGLALPAARRAEIDAALSAQAQANLAVHVVTPTITAVDVAVTVQRVAGADDAAVRAAVVAALEDHLSPDRWPWSATVYRNELIALVDRVTDVDRVVDVTTPAADVALPGVANLVTPGTLTVTVVAP